MNLIDKLLARVAAAFAGGEPAAPKRVLEAAGANGLPEDDDEGWTRLTASGGAAAGRDLTPMSQDRMQRLAEWLWQSNLLANRLVEIPLAYLLAEGVRLECADEAHQKLLDAFWRDPINDWPEKLYPRARSLALYGEQCYTVHRNEFTGFVRLGYLAPQRIGQVVLDPDNAEQPIGVITKKNARGEYSKYRVLVLGDDADLFSRRTAEIRAGFTDGDVFLFQVNKLADGSRGRSDLIGQMDWIDAYDEFLFGELDRARYLRAFVWDLNVKTGTKDDVEQRAKTFRPPEPNSVYVHNDGEELTPKAPELQAADSADAARLFRNHVLAGSTVPEHWFGGGGDVNRAAAAEMGDPTFKLFTARQTALKMMLEKVGRYVLMSQPDAAPDWSDPAWTVTARFPELVSKDVTKFSAAMRDVATAALLLVDRGLLTEERALGLVADIAGRFGQEIDVKAEIEAARLERAQRRAEDAFHDPAADPGTDPAGRGRDVPRRGPARPDGDAVAGALSDAVIALHDLAREHAGREPAAARALRAAADELAALHGRVKALVALVAAAAGDADA